MKRPAILILTLALLLAGCQMPFSGGNTSSGGMGPGMGADFGMMNRHRAPVPEAYADLSNPIAAEEESINRGGEVYAANCASCHGDGGMGDGPAAQALDPAPAPIAHTSQMLGDDYLFWRINEGGAPFGTAMPAWGETLSENEIWDVINYVRALGRGQASPRSSMGGAMNDPAVQAAQQAEMLAQAVSQGVITQEEADTFAAVHAALDDYMTANPGTGNAEQRQTAGLSALVAAGTITQSQADTFLSVRDRLSEAGLMR